MSGPRLETLAAAVNVTLALYSLRLLPLYSLCLSLSDYRLGLVKTWGKAARNVLPLWRLAQACDPVLVYLHFNSQPSHNYL